MSTSSTSPATYFGGTWDRLKSRFLLAADDSTYKAAATGGASTVTLTTAQMPKHWHWVGANTGGGYDGSGTYGLGMYRTNASAGGLWRMPAYQGNDGAPENWLATDNVGSSNAHENMPPYLVVYMWKRTA